MAVTQEQISSLLATSLIPGILREAGVTEPSEIEDFFESRLCSQLVDGQTGMWELGAVSLAEAYRMERAGIDYQEPRAIQ